VPGAAGAIQPSNPNLAVADMNHSALVDFLKQHVGGRKDSKDSSEH